MSKLTLTAADLKHDVCKWAPQALTRSSNKGQEAAGPAEWVVPIYLGTTKNIEFGENTELTCQDTLKHRLPCLDAIYILNLLLQGIGLIVKHLQMVMNRFKL